MLDIIIPIFAAFSHLIFVINFIFINRESLKRLASNIAIPIFIAGHLIIIANLTRHSINQLTQPKSLSFDKTTRDYGILGHALLAISIIMQVSIFRNMDFNIYRVLFVIGQIGMMLLYYLAYQQKSQINTINNINNITIDIKSLFFIIPALIIFYIREAIIATTGWQKIVAIIMTIVYIDWIIYVSTLI